MNFLQCSGWTVDIEPDTLLIGLQDPDPDTDYFNYFINE